MGIGNNIKDAFRGSGGPWLVIGDVEVDASVEEVHSIEAETTDHEVEDGSEITDHYKKLPAKLEITGIVTDVISDTVFPGQAIFEAIKAAKEQSPEIEAWFTVEKYADEGTLITIVTSLKTYESMAITNFRVTRDKTRKNAILFSCSAKEIRIVSTEETAAVTVKEPLDDTVRGAADKKGKGAANKASDTKKAAAEKSLAKSLFGG